MASLAPKAYSSGRLSTSSTTVSATPVPTSKAKVLPKITWALSRSPLPRWMENSGEPPMPNRLAKAVTMERMGKVSPRPVKALPAASGRRPMYMRSTTLYSTLISWATVMGRARRRMFPATLPLEKSFVWVFAMWGIPFLSGGVCCFINYCTGIAPKMQAAAPKCPASKKCGGSQLPFVYNPPREGRTAKTQVFSQIRAFQAGGLVV